MKKLWSWIKAAGVKFWIAITAALAVLVGVIAKIVLGRKSQASADTIPAAQVTHATTVKQDAESVQTANAFSEGKASATTAAVQAIADTTEPESTERVDALAALMQQQARNREAKKQ